MADTSLPEVRAWPWGRGYQAHFRKPGGSWQFVRGADKRPVIYPTSEAAKDAATEIVFRFMCPEIKAVRGEPEAMAKKLTADVAGFRERRAAERVEDRKVFRGLGKGFVPVHVRSRG